MRQLAELIPILLFFIAYQMDGTVLGIGGWTYTFEGIFSATEVLIVATIAQVALVWLITREVEKRLLWLLAAVCLFGGATLLFRDQSFIQWKPTVFNWALAAAFALSHFIGQRNLMQHILGGQIELPAAVWTRLLWLWVAYFALVGILNLLVAYQFSEAFWVSYKLYSAIGFTLLLALVTGTIIASHLPEDGLRGERKVGGPR